MDRATIDLIIAHMNIHPCVRDDGKKLQNQYPLLAEAMKSRCAADPQLGIGKYRPIAQRLPAISKMLGVPSPERINDPTIEATMEHIETVRKDMHKGADQAWHRLFSCGYGNRMRFTRGICSSAWASTCSWRVRRNLKLPRDWCRLGQRHSLYSI